MRMQKEVSEVTFQESFRNAILSSTKLATTRPQRLGEVGSRFVAFGQKFVIVNVEELPLGLVAAFLYRAEGFETREAFIDFWCQLCPDMDYRPDQIVCFHLFMKTDL